jgi:hypothetical protein
MMVTLAPPAIPNIHIRHPEVAAKRPSKDARPGPSPFEARSFAARTSR